jgi:SpoVK/Ycf46/Vps4 family AAA+-type ATPase
VALWVDFSNECQRIQRLLKPEQKVIIIGGSNESFVPTVEWDDIILPSELKSDFLRDVETFFSNGVEIYQQLNLKPFRKLLLAGVPGTGKTMLCNALAKWALERDYLVVYISSTDPEGASFRKIERALQEAAESKYPTLMILEEVDAYLHSRQKAMVLNVLDGSESAVNERGTLLVATTNYPEAIDERVLKRPGRLDRVFIVPETQTESEAEKMLQWYLGEKWLEEHSEVAWDLVGYPGAFIREVAIHALTQVAFDGSPNLSADTLRESFDNLREYIDKRDAFLAKAAHRKQPVVGFMEKL